MVVRLHPREFFVFSLKQNPLFLMTTSESNIYLTFFFFIENIYFMRKIFLYIICVVSNWMLAFVIVMAFPEMRNSMKMFGVTLFFSVICILAIFFGLFVIKNKQNQGCITSTSRAVCTK